MPHILQTKVLVSSQSQNPPRCSNNNVGTLILEQFFVNLDVDTTIENSNFYIWKICAESFNFMTNLDKFKNQIIQKPKKKMHMWKYNFVKLCGHSRLAFNKHIALAKHLRYITTKLMQTYLIS
jgi:hypothetical protein